MIKQIRLQNFMSHTDTVLDLADGLNVLVGPNNCGKSAVVEALRAVCQNVTASYMIRHGEKEARVSLTTTDGHTVVWIRTKTSAAYDIDGVRYDRLQGKVPDQLHRILRMPMVSVEGSEEVDVHIAYQKDPIFLLNAPGSRPAAFFASSSDAGRIIQMQELHRARKRERERDKRKLDAEVADLDATLEALKPLGEVRKQQLEADTLYDEIELNDRQAEQLRTSLDEISSAAATVALYRRRSDPLHALKQPPEIHNVAPLEYLLNGLKTTHGDVTCCFKKVQSLSELPKPPSLFDTSGLRQTTDRLSAATEHNAACDGLIQILSDLREPPELGDVVSLRRTVANLDAYLSLVQRARHQMAQMEGLLAPPQIHDLSQLEQILRLMDQCQADLGSCRQKVDILDDLRKAPEVAETTGLRQMVASLGKARSELETAKAELKSVKDELSDAERSLSVWVKDNPKCPTCGGTLTVETLLGGHNHA